MTKAQVKTVTLPDGKVVSVSNSPETWWTTDNGSGYVDPRLIAPDPRQPREHMDTVELAELTQSVGERGVRDPPTVTPLKLAPWAEVAPEHKALPFIIVSGHRRRMASLDAKLEAVPIRVVIYKNKEDYLLDASILNTNRARLTPLEQGREIVRLRDNGVTLEKIQKSLGCSGTHIYNRINLTRLHPAIQDLFKPTLTEKKRLSVTTAGELGSVGSPSVEELEELNVLFLIEIKAAREPGLVPKKDFTFDSVESEEARAELRRFELQKIFLAVIRHRHLDAARAKELIIEHKLQLDTAQENPGKKTRRFEPHKRKEILTNLTREVSGSTVIDWTPNEFRRIFENATDEEVERFRVMFHRAAGTLVDIEELLKKVRDEKRAESSKVTR